METTTAPAASVAPVRAPASIARDTYAGRWTRVGIPANLAAATYTARELADLAPEGVIWESFGMVYRGREGFARTRYVATAAGDLACYASDGRLVIRHPADRPLRILTTRP